MNPDGGGAGTSGAQDLELFSWWVAPGEAEALQSLVNTYKTSYPMARVSQYNNTTAGDWQTILAMNIDNSPWDAVQLSAAGISTFLKDHPDSLLPLDTLYDEPSLKAAVIPDVLKAATVDGHPMGMVTGVHRNNAFLYNKELLSKNNVTAPTTIAEFLTACEKLKAAGVTPVATSLDSWVLRFMYLELLSGHMGAQDFGDFITHKLPLSDQKVKDGITAAVDTFDTVMTKYVDITASKAPKYDWSAAAEAIRSNKAAFFMHGDWAKGYLVNLGWTPGVDFGVSGPPGASDLFIYGVDTFALPKTAPHPERAREFLAVVGSKDGQVNFNKMKGSTPMRTDVRDRLDSASQQSLDDLANAKVRLPGIDNGMWDTAMGAYVTSGDKAALLATMLTITP